jgi:hypothetical protein
MPRELVFTRQATKARIRKQLRKRQAESENLKKVVIALLRSSQRKDFLIQELVQEIHVLRTIGYKPEADIFLGDFTVRPT